MWYLKSITCGRDTDYSKSRPVPEPNLIENFLKSNANFTGKIGHQDRVCCACYRSHLFVIKHIKKSVQSTDIDLIAVIDKIKTNISKEIVGYEDALTCASCLSAIYVGQALLKQTALLLPHVYEYFQTELKKIIQQYSVTPPVLHG